MNISDVAKNRANQQDDSFLRRESADYRPDPQR